MREAEDIVGVIFSVDVDVDAAADAVCASFKPFSIRVARPSRST